MEIFISTSLGFVSAISVEFLFKYINNKENTKNILNGIKKELQNIEQQVLSLKGDRYYVTPLNTSYWKSLLHTDSLNNIISHPLYIDIITIYHYIGNLNHWENIHSSSYFSTGKSNLDLNNALQTQRRELIVELQNTINKF